jgi:hypothetical protein
VEDDEPLFQVKAYLKKFQSTHAVWGATALKLRLILPIRCFNPRSRVGSDVYINRSSDYPVSIHAPCVGSDSAAS